MAGNDASRVALRTVPGTVPGVVRKVASEVFPAVICGSILTVTREVFCRLKRKGVRRMIRTASPNATCGHKGLAIAEAIRTGTAVVVCGGISDASLKSNAEGLRRDGMDETDGHGRKDMKDSSGLPAPGRAEAGPRPGFCELGSSG